MANYLSVFEAPDEHINFLSEYPDSLLSYVQGASPSLDELKPRKKRAIAGLFVRKQSAIVPAWWPKTEIDIHKLGINRRNVDLYHRILNGVDRPVRGSGSLFQTWWFDGPHSAIDIGGYREDFAFLSHQLSELSQLLGKVNLGSIATHFTHWLRVHGNDHIPAREECEFVFRDIIKLKKCVNGAISRKNGILWTGS